MPANISKLLSNDILNRIERMRVNPRRRLTGKHRGEHLSGRGGASMDFADYRDYSPGDDTRFVDWNLFARLQRPYLKLFRMEEEMNLLIIIDSSESMVFSGKFKLAQQLAASLGVMGLFGNERVSVWAPNKAHTGTENLPALTGRSNMRKLLSFISDIKPSGDFSYDQAIEHCLRYHKGKGLVLLLSDFLAFPDFSHSFNALFTSGLEIMGVQILAPEELDPQLYDDARFVDCEKNSTLDISSGGDLMGIYHEHLQNHIDSLEKSCNKRAGRFVSVSSDIDLKTLLFNQLQRRAWFK